MRQHCGSRSTGWLSTIRAFGVAGRVAAIMIVLSACQSSYAGKMETLTIATVPTDINAMLYVAEAQNFFAANGLQVTLKEDYDSGATATTGMLNGEADVATASEFLIVRHAFNKADMISFGTITRYENTFMSWRTDSGIKTIEDLKGRKIGVPLQTIAEFYLGRTLDLNGINIQEVSLVDVRTGEAENALVNNKVDAVVTWEPWASQINKRMGNEITTSALQSSQYAYWNLVSTTDWAKKHPNILQRLVKALVQTEDYIIGHPAEAKAIVGKRMNFDDEYMDIVWERYRFSLSLDQSLIIAMEDEARWMINNNLTAEKEVPNILDYIYIDSLEAAKPNVINIIR
jgi:NitT/TauT family transport system substrate-binding protein